MLKLTGKKVRLKICRYTRGLKFEQQQVPDSQQPPHPQLRGSDTVVPIPECFGGDFGQAFGQDLGPLFGQDLGQIFG